METAWNAGKQKNVDWAKGSSGRHDISPQPVRIPSKFRNGSLNTPAKTEMKASPELKGAAVRKSTPRSLQPLVVVEGKPLLAPLPAPKNPRAAALAVPVLAPTVQPALLRPLTADKLEARPSTTDSQHARRGGSAPLAQPPTGGTAEERGWGEKYRFFSARHMRRCFPTYSAARTDPFNKDPSWGRAILMRVTNDMAQKGITPTALFNSIDLTGDGSLDRAEMRLALTSVLPSLSDMEAAAIFDTIDEDGGGEVSIKEFCEATSKAKAGGPVRQSQAKRWRNPIHRISRFAPARIEGWDHVEEPCSRKDVSDLATSQNKEVMTRLHSALLKSPRALRHDVWPQRYSKFAGGGDSSRFVRQEWEKSGQMQSAALGADESPIFKIPDPGPELRPGFMCDTMGKQVSRSFGLKA